MATLQTYITQCRRLLHDANANFWSDSELTDYINAARQRLVRDTGCLRTIQTVNTVTNQEVYQFSALPSGIQTMDILNINLYWGNTRIPLRYLPWTQFNAELRFWQNYYGRPIAFSVYGQQSFYLSPVPDQVYQMELDTIILPTDLVNTTDTDSIISPWTEIFLNQYKAKAMSVINTTFTRRMPDPYSTPY